MPEFIRKVEDLLQRQANSTLVVAKALRSSCIRLVCAWFVITTTAALVACRLLQMEDLFSYYAVVVGAATVLISRYSSQYLKQPAYFEEKYVQWGWIAIWVSTTITLALAVLTTPLKVNFIIIAEIVASFPYISWIRNISAVRVLEGVITHGTFKVVDDTILRQIYSEAGEDSDKALEVFIKRFSEEGE